MPPGGSIVFGGRVQHIIVADISTHCKGQQNNGQILLVVA